MHALPLMLPALCVLAIAYRYYSAFLATRVLVLDDARPTPAHTHADGQNFHATNKYVLFGHHFAAITGAGPLIGPVLATQFGFAPGFLWILVGVVLAGAVHDFVILTASIRHGGKSLAQIAAAEISPRAGLITSLAILAIIVVALAGLGVAVVNALSESAWGVFTVAASIPLALFMGVYMYIFRKGKVLEATAIGVAGMIAAVIFGRDVAASSIGHWFHLSRGEITLSIAIYGFLASVLPVWLLLCPRDYLSSFLKLGTIAALVVGVLVVNPELHAPAFSQFVDGGGPIVAGKLFPFMFITIACGAISGFHSLVASGTTPKMLDRESHARPIGYGAMLLEGLVGLTALIAAASLHPADYYAINTSAQKFAGLGMSMVNLRELESQVGEAIAGRPGGAVSLAVGMAQIFSAIPGMRGLMSYWYHFAIMFEAMFVLTTIDTGTRVARFLVQEFLGRFHPKFHQTDWLPGGLIAAALVVASWGTFLWTGSIDTIWPVFGIANQLLAVIALSVGTMVIRNTGRQQYVWVTLAPMAVLSLTTLSAGIFSISDLFLPMAHKPGTEFKGWFNTVLAAGMMACVLLVWREMWGRWRGNTVVALSPSTPPHH